MRLQTPKPTIAIMYDNYEQVHHHSSQEEEYGGCGTTTTSKWDDDRPAWPIWPFDASDYWPIVELADYQSVSKAAANYYMLEVIRWNLKYPGQNVDQSITDEANRRFDLLVEKWDTLFLEYLTMTIGGEARHHIALRHRILPTDRTQAWCAWKTIWDREGVDCLDYLADLFAEAEQGSDVCGEPWAQVCRILKSRLLGKLGPNEKANKALFVDRVFTLEHNNGCFLNKLGWRGLQELPEVLAIHGRGFEVEEMLAEYCSPAVQDLYREYKQSANPVERMFDGLEDRLMTPWKTLMEKHTLHTLHEGG